MFLSDSSNQLTHRRVDGCDAIASLFVRYPSHSRAIWARQAGVRAGGVFKERAGLVIRQLPVILVPAVVIERFRFSHVCVYVILILQAPRLPV